MLVGQVAEVNFFVITRLKPTHGRQGLKDGILGPELSLHFGVFSISPAAPIEEVMIFRAIKN